MKNESDEMLAMLISMEEHFMKTAERGVAVYESNSELAFRAVRQRLSDLRITRYALLAVTLGVIWTFMCRPEDNTKWLLLILSAIMFITYVVTLRNRHYRIADALAKEWIPIRKKLLKEVLPHVQGLTVHGARSCISKYLRNRVENLLQKEEALLISEAKAEKTKIMKLISFFEEHFGWTYNFRDILREVRDVRAGVPVTITMTVQRRKELLSVREGKR